MAQIIGGFGMKGTGIVAVLIIAGIALFLIGLSNLANAAIFAGIAFAIIFGFLGVLGILRRIF